MKNEYRIIKKLNSKYITLIGHRINLPNIQKYYEVNDISYEELMNELIKDFEIALDEGLRLHSKNKK